MSRDTYVESIIVSRTLSPVESGWLQRSGRMLLPRPTLSFLNRSRSSVPSARPLRETSSARNVRNLGRNGAPCGRLREEPGDGKGTKYADWWLTGWMLQRFLINSFHAESWWLVLIIQHFNWRAKLPPARLLLQHVRPDWLERHGSEEEGREPLLSGLTTSQ